MFNILDPPLLLIQIKSPHTATRTKTTPQLYTSDTTMKFNIINFYIRYLYEFVPSSSGCSAHAAGPEVKSLRERN